MLLKTHNLKFVTCFALFLCVCTMLTGCGALKRSGITADQFVSIVSDTTGCSTSAVDGAEEAEGVVSGYYAYSDAMKDENDDYACLVEFYQTENSNYAVAYYQNIESQLNELYEEATNKVKSHVTGLNYEVLEMTIDGKYYYAEYLEDTFLFVYGPSEYKSTLKEVITAINY